MSRSKFTRESLEETDPQLHDLICRQTEYESKTLKLIPSENYAPDDVLEVTGSILTNKYCEGYPTRRYYEGNDIMDEIELLAISRARALFGAEHANVQPYSGSPANQAVYRALCRKGDRIMGMPVPEGGHLTHGWGVNFSGTDYEQVAYSIDVATGELDYDAVARVAMDSKPRVIWVGGTSYPRYFHYDRFAEIARKVDAYLVADISHINGLIVAKQHPDPVEYCDVVTSTTHKMLRGPRGGLILSRVEDKFQSLYHPDSKYNLAQRVDRMVFPHLQGGPHMNVVAAMAVAFKRADSTEFREYAKQIVLNAKALAQGLMEHGYSLVSGGTDNHLILMDFRNCEFTGKAAAKALARAGIITNFNMVPGDCRKPFVTSGVRLGTPAVTALGMKEREMAEVASFIHRVLTDLDDEQEGMRVSREVETFCSHFTEQTVNQ